MEGDERERGFKVQDRRRFSATGEARDEEAAEAAAPSAAPEPAATPPSPDAAAATFAGHSSEITFAAFVISLSAQALAHLGEIPDPVEQATRVDLEGARQIIDILGILSEKTRGNLDAAEGSLLDSALYDLRMKYVGRAHGR